MKDVSLLSRLARGAALLAASGVLTACAALSAVNDATQALDVYELQPPAGLERVARRPLQRDVSIELPTTAGSLATDRILIRPSALQAEYLPDVRWSEETPVMVQTLMLRSVEATGAVRYVGRRPLGASGDFALVTEVVDFQAELADDGESATVQIELIVRVVREQDARIIASRTFEATSPAATTETPALVAAFDAAANAVFSDFAVWLPDVLAGR